MLKTAVLTSVLVPCLLFWLFVTGVLSPLKKTIRVIGRVGQGELNVELPMGTPVDCAARKKCGRKECPSFGKVDNCWVTSGSFALIKHCPRARNGEDCRSCELYGAGNELEELGSILTGMVNNIRDRTRITNAIVEGDLAQEIELVSEHDDLGRAYQQMCDSLSDIIGQFQTAAMQVSAGSTQVADASQSLSQGATESAASLEEINSTMTEIASQTKANARNAGQANQMTGQVQEAAERGNNRMSEMVSAMAEINQAAENISRIIKVIDEIAFQTNLLALNAAVEAARAGQHGKGFAVVAEEVRNLAARSAKAARETADLIEGSVATTARGAEIANQTAAALEDMVQGVGRVSTLMAEIAASSDEQASGVGEVSQGLAEIDQVTQQNTSTAEECAAAAEELTAQAEHLKQLMRHFTLRYSGEEREMVPHLPAV